MEIVTTENLPVEQSMRGDNTCYLHCPSLNRRSNYGVCLFTIRAFNNGKLNENSDCYSLVGRGLCEALSYQKQEQEAGRALFYKKREIPSKDITDTPFKAPESRPRFQPLTPNDEGYIHGLNGSSKPAKKAEPEPEKAKSSVFGTETADLSDAVNEAVKEELEQKAKPTEEKSVKETPAKEKPKPKATKGVKPGMSILERARAMSGGK